MNGWSWKEPNWFDIEEVEETLGGDKLATHTMSDELPKNKI